MHSNRKFKRIDKKSENARQKECNLHIKKTSSERYSLINKIVSMKVLKIIYFYIFSFISF